METLSTANGSPEEQASPLVQYVVLRKDLGEGGLGWPLGSITAQACHASTAALWMSKDQETTKEYCSQDNLDNMHKVVLHVKGETQLINLSRKLEEADVMHKLWTEQPENFATCLATRPYVK
eukprot:CAMPEP_0196580112 /NCGR_PEP_ID=MMETSP1081-20130531/27038_1 /TAXON_ID=36882 /ORGANISM="Pyramimonas amylifera, Strain CCMP720" /LENGTH=121 /DNA_ID=CAMNT_0041899899 /DNA_START=242 /DNA_END=604 /DNA_ORIENTATION=+